jgi:hypothetical protein
MRRDKARKEGKVKYQLDYRKVYSRKPPRARIRVLQDLLAQRPAARAHVPLGRIEDFGMRLGFVVGLWSTLAITGSRPS